MEQQSSVQALRLTLTKAPAGLSLAIAPGVALLLLKDELLEQAVSDVEVLPLRHRIELELLAKLHMELVKECSAAVFCCASSKQPAVERADLC